MNYKFAKITTFYRSFLTNFYKRFPDLKSSGYDEQYRVLMDQKFGWADFFKTELEKLGNEAVEIVGNAEYLQGAWCRENGTSAKGIQLLIEQLRFYKPEVVMFQDSLTFGGEYLRDLKKMVPSIRLLIGWCCSPYSPENLKHFRHFDLVLACSDEFTRVFSGMGLKTYELNHGFEASLAGLLQVNNNYPESDLLFIGSLINNPDFHDERIRILELLLESGLDMKIFSDIKFETATYLKMRQASFVLARMLKSAGLNKINAAVDPLRKAAILTGMPKKQNFSQRFMNSVDGTPLFGIEMFKALSKGKTGFNIHGGIAGEYAANSRMFEVTGCGSCLLTDRKKNINKFFEDGSEIVTYASAEECIEKAKYLSDHGNERIQIAASGQKRTLRDHNFTNRVELLNSIILENIK